MGVRQVEFDSNVFQMTVGNSSSCCISPCTQDFEKKIRLASKTVDVIASELTCVGTSTVKWKVWDDEGVTHTFRILNALYVPKVPMRILSP